MRNKKFFDVIFSTKHFDTNRLNINSLLKKQEQRDPRQERRIFEAIDSMRQNIGNMMPKRSGLRVTFGFNITSSINFTLNVLPWSIVTTTSEFPPVIHMLNNMSRAPMAYFELGSDKNSEIIQLAEPISGQEIILLISHVSYFDGLNILDVMMDSPSCLKYLSQFKVHVLIDGAHAVGNIFAIEDIGVLKEKIGSKLNLSSFTYTFDCYKWLQGLWGLSIIISDSQKIIDSHSAIYPNTRWAKDTLGFLFSQPYSASFNPNLIFWFLNSKILKKIIPTLKKHIAENNKLTNHFLSAQEITPHKNIVIVSGPTKYHTNMLSFKTQNATQLYEYLIKNRIVGHLIGGKILKTLGESRKYPSVTRLCFSSKLVKMADMHKLIKILSKYD